MFRNYRLIIWRSSGIKLKIFFNIHVGVKLLFNFMSWFFIIKHLVLIQEKKIMEPDQH